MFPLIPPDDPFFLQVNLFGFPLEVRWYGVLIIGGAMIAAWVATKRAMRRGFEEDDVWNQLLLGLVLGILCARLYYVAFQWDYYQGRPFLEVINPQTGGLAIHGGIIGAILSAAIYTAWRRLPLLNWLDICIPTMLIGQSIGRWGNFFNREAYGRPTDLPIGVAIPAENRLPPYDNMQQYPPEQLFHATFLYESLWNIAGFGLIVWLEKRFKLRTGSSVALYGAIYGAGRFWIEGLRTDSLCVASMGGECEGTFRAAQIASVLLIVIGLGFFAWVNRSKVTGIQDNYYYPGYDNSTHYWAGSLSDYSPENENRAERELQNKQNHDDDRDGAESSHGLRDTSDRPGKHDRDDDRTDSKDTADRDDSRDSSSSDDSSSDWGSDSGGDSGGDSGSSD